MMSCICGIVMALGVSCLVYDVNNYHVMLSIMIIIGIAQAYQIPITSKAALIATEGTIGLTTSYTNMLLMLFGYVFHSIIGKVATVTNSITSGVSVVPIAATIGAVGFLILSMREKIRK